jgi:hypothetical protein
LNSSYFQILISSSTIHLLVQNPGGSTLAHISETIQHRILRHRKTTVSNYSQSKFMLLPTHFSFPVSIHFKSISIDSLALLDSKATTCFMDEKFVRKLHICIIHVYIHRWIIRYVCIYRTIVIMHVRKQMLMHVCMYIWINMDVNL